MKARIRITLLLLVLLTSLCYGVTSTITSFIGQSNPFNITFTGNQNQSFVLPIPQYGYVTNVSLNLNTYNITNPTYNYCFQNLSNQSNSCGGLNTGGYPINQLGIDPGNATDGNYETYGVHTGGTDQYIYMNWSLPNNFMIGVDKAIFQLKVTAIFSNYTLPDICINSTNRKIFIELLSGGGSAYTRARCLNTTTNDWGWSYLIRQGLGGEGGEIYDSSMFWATALNNYSIFLGNNLLYNSTIRIYNFNLSLNSSITNSLLASNQPINLTFHSDTAGILQVNLTNATYSYGIDNCSNSFGIPSNATTLNISYFDDIYFNPLAADSQGIFYYGAYNYTFSGNSVSKQSFCIYPNWNTQTVTGQILYSKTDYASKVYNIDGSTTLFFNNNTQFLNLYLTNLSTSTIVKINWLTNQYIAVTGTLYIYKCSGTGIKTLVETSTISNGVSYSNLNLLNTLYSYSVLYNGILYEETNSYSKCHIESASDITYYITTETTDNTQPLGMYSIVCNMTNTSANTVKMSWSNNPYSTLPITGCIYAFRNGITGWVQTYTDCANLTNSIERTIPVTGYEYEVRGRIYQGGYSIPCETVVGFYGNKPAATTFGLIGLFSIAFLIIGVGLFFVGDDIKQTAGAVIAIILAWILGLWNFDWMQISAICAFLLIIMLIGRSASKR